MLTQIQRPGVLVNPVFARRLIADIEERDGMLQEIAAERDRYRDADSAIQQLALQAERWKKPMPVLGEPNAAGIWVLKLVEEIGEVAAALLGQAIAKDGRGDPQEELDQVIAVALAMRATLQGVALGEATRP